MRGATQLYAALIDTSNNSLIVGWSAAMGLFAKAQRRCRASDRLVEYTPTDRTRGLGG